MYVDTTTQTPRSVFPQMPKSLLYPNSQLHDAIDPSKGNLKQQRQNLKLKKEKLASNMQEVEEQLHRIAKQSGIVEDLEESFRLMNSLPIFQMNCEFKEAHSQRSILAKFGSDLQQQIDFIQSQIDQATYQLKQKKEKEESEEKEEVDTMRIVERKIREQEIQLKQLRAISDALNTEVLSRENEVIQLEMKASEHLNEIKRVKKFNYDLCDKKCRILQQRNKIFVQKQLIEEERKKYLERMENANIKISLAIHKSKELDKLEEELNEKEKELKKKVDEFTQMKCDRSKKKIEEAKKRQVLKQQKERQQLNEMRYLAKEEDELIYEINEIEFQISSDQKAVDSRYNNLSVTKESKDTNFNLKKSNLLVIVNDYQDKLKDKKTPDQLASEIKAVKEENEKISKETEEKTVEINEIKKKLTPEEKVDEMKKELQKQMKATIIHEREINSQLGAIKAEEREASNDEEEMKRNLSLIEAEISLTKKNDSATTSMLKICKEQAETLRKRYEIYLQAQQLEQ